MATLRWILAFALLLGGEHATGTSIAEEINFEVSNMKESAKNDPQVYLLQEMVENDEDDAGKENFEDPETSPSEIVETHVLPNEGEPEEVNVQMKRPRRRRRRRRRKRPKPVVNAEELEPYYTIPEDEINSKPIKYRLPENVDVLVPESSNVPRRRNTKRRRRPVKQPPVDDYPTTAEGENAEYANHTEEHVAEFSSNDQPSAEEGREKNKIKIEYKEKNEDPRTENIAKAETDYQKSVRKVHKKTKEKDGDNASSLGEDYKTQHSVSESEFSKTSTPDERRKSQLKNQNDENESNSVRPQEETRKSLKAPELAKISPSIENRKPENHHHKETETLKYFDELNGTVRRRKRPYFKSENPTTAGAEVAKGTTSERTTLGTLQTEFKDFVHGANKSEIKIVVGAKENASKVNFVENHKTKHEDQAKANDTSKKEVFKLRRLPPISAILRHVKVRPIKNETMTSTKAPVKNEATNKLKESISNEILTHVALTDAQKAFQNYTFEELEEAGNRSSNTTMADEFDQPITSDSTNNPLTSDDFEFPIIIYTEQKQSQKVASTPSPAAKTTETTAFIYIPCNQTINEVLKNTFNFTSDENVTTAATKRLNSTQNHTDAESIPTTSNKDVQNDTLSILGSLAMEELEKLLQRTEIEGVYLNNVTEMENETDISKNETRTLSFQPVNADDLEVHLNYAFQNKTNTNSAKLPFVTDPQEVKVSTEQNYFREPKWYQDTSKYKHESDEDSKYDIPFAKSYTGSSKELVISYTSTTTSANSAFNEIDTHETLFRENELSLHLRNNSFRRRISQEGVMHKKNNTERKKLPLAVKSAIIISGAILALAVLGFFALLLSCKIRQAKSRMKCHRELYREQFQNSEFRQSSRSTSPVVSKSNYNGRSFTNNIQSNVASNRNYYLWQTLRKTFQYD